MQLRGDRLVPGPPNGYDDAGLIVEPFAIGERLFSPSNWFGRVVSWSDCLNTRMAANELFGGNAST
jgi:hypothetical protein